MAGRRILCAILCISLLAGAANALHSFPRATAERSEQAASLPLIIVVRHAERGTEPADDPALSPAGVDRARALVTALEKSRVTAVITSEFRRTRETAEPLAARFSITPEVVAVRGAALPAHVEAVAAAARKHTSGVIVVVGHSNTVPAIIAALGGERMPDLCEAQYAGLYVLARTAAGVELVKGLYGAPDVGC